MKRGCLSDRQGKAMIRLGPGKKRELECQIGLIKRDRCFRCFLPSFLNRNQTNWMDFASCVSRSFDQYWIVWMVFFPVCGLPILISLFRGPIFLDPWTKSDRQTVRVKITSSLFMNPRMLVLVDQTLDLILQFPVAADGHSDRYTRHLTYTHR